MKYKLGEFIEQCETRNSDNSLTLSNLKGISIQKVFIETKAKMNSVSLLPYKVVKPDEFAYVTVTSRNSDKITIAHNDTENTFIVSSSYIVFKIIKSKKLNSDYLYMFFNRPEFDRLARYNSWGSARETFSWDDMCDIDIELPSIEIQEKYVAVYNAMLANQKSYAKGLDDLKLVCDASIDRFKHNQPHVEVGSLLKEIDERNYENEFSDVQGINISKNFMPSKSTSADLSKYKVIRNGTFAYSSMQTGRDEVIRIALYNKNSPALISPAYQTLVTRGDVLPEYVMIWFSRKESDRYGWFISDGSIRASLELSRFFEIKIPLPSIESQQSIVDIYNSYINRREIVVKMKSIIKEICPILIAGSVKEAKNYVEV